MRAWKTLAIAVAAAALASTASVASARALLGAEATPSAATANAIGGDTSESEYVAITPCRLVDTRQASAGALPVGSSRQVAVRGGGAAFAAQGGKSGGCAIPAGATAVEVTVTAVDAGSGFLRLWPSTQSQPNATFMNYDEAFNVSNTGTVSLCPSGCTAGEDLQARAYGNATDLVIDVQGYYQAPLVAVVAADGTLLRGSRVTSTNQVVSGVYQVRFDRDIRSCSAQATVLEGNAISSGYETSVYLPASDQLQTVANIMINNDTNNPSTIGADKAFFLEVTC